MTDIAWMRWAIYSSPAKQKKMFVYDEWKKEVASGLIGHNRNGVLHVTTGLVPEGRFLFFIQRGVIGRDVCIYYHIPHISGVFSLRNMLDLENSPTMSLCHFN